MDSSGWFFGRSSGCSSVEKISGPMQSDLGLLQSAYSWSPHRRSRGSAAGSSGSGCRTTRTIKHGDRRAATRSMTCCTFSTLILRKCERQSASHRKSRFAKTAERASAVSSVSAATSATFVTVARATTTSQPSFFEAPNADRKIVLRQFFGRIHFRILSACVEFFLGTHKQKG